MNLKPSTIKLAWPNLAHQQYPKSNPNPRRFFETSNFIQLGTSLVSEAMMAGKSLKDKGSNISLSSWSNIVGRWHRMKRWLTWLALDFRGLPYSSDFLIVASWSGSLTFLFEQRQIHPIHPLKFDLESNSSGWKGIFFSKVPSLSHRKHKGFVIVCLSPQVWPTHVFQWKT